MIFDVAVIGGGYYGCKVASTLAAQGRSVVLLEVESHLMQRASRWNQARVHHGYHYPRHTLTALSSAKNYLRFVDEYRDCIFDQFQHIYAIPKEGSFVTAKQFGRFMERVGLETKVAKFNQRKLFAKDKFDQFFEVAELVFDAEKLRQKITDELQEKKVQVRLQAKIENLSDEQGAWQIRLDKEELSAKKVFNCTYAGLNEILSKAQVPLLPLRFELAELALVELPPEFQQFGLTVMDGPFFSVLPFPTTKWSSVSHVRYTPHKSWDRQVDTKLDLRHHPPKSKFPAMVRAIAQYMPGFIESRYQNSFWEYKTILPKNEVNDGRPILYHQHPTRTPLVSLMGGKIDNFYDLEKFLHEGST